MGYAPQGVGTGVTAEGRAKSATVTYLSVPGVETSTVTAQGITADRLYYMPMCVTSTISLDQLVVEVTIAGAGGTVARLGIYNADTDWQPTSLVEDSGLTATVPLDAAAVTEISIGQTLTAGRYLLAYVGNGGPALRIVKGGSRYAGYLNTLGATPFVEQLYVAFAYAALPDPGTAWDTVVTAATPFRYWIFPRISSP